MNTGPVLEAKLSELDSQLRGGLRALALPDTKVLRDQLLKYLALLQKWGRVHNLSAIMDPAEMISRHLLDSLTASSYIQGTTVADVGSGAGFPGLPLAIVYPELAVTLIESRRKKVQFLHQVLHQLQLHNVRIAHERVERFEPLDKFDTLTARAFSSLDGLIDKAGHLCAAQGRIVAMKGRFPAKELDDLAIGLGSRRFRLDGVHRVMVPGCSAQRHIVVLKAEESEQEQK